MNPDEQHHSHQGCAKESVMVFVATGFFVGLTMGVKALIDVLFTEFTISSGKIIVDHIGWVLLVDILVWLVLTCLFYYILRRIRRRY